MKKTILSVMALALARLCRRSANAQRPEAPRLFQLTEPEGAAWNVLPLHVNNMRNAFAAQVDSGVAELARKQEAGWAYIR